MGEDRGCLFSQVHDTDLGSLSFFAMAFLQFYFFFFFLWGMMGVQQGRSACLEQHGQWTRLRCPPNKGYLELRVVIRQNPRFQIKVQDNHNSKWNAMIKESRQSTKNPIHPANRIHRQSTDFLFLGAFGYQTHASKLGLIHLWFSSGDQQCLSGLGTQQHPRYDCWIKSNQ